MSLFRKTITLGRVSALAAILSFASAAAVANAQATPLTPLDKQLSRLDLAVSGMGSITKSTTGPQVTPPSTTITDDPSNTVGALVTLRYIKSPLVGLEFNYTYARFNQNFGYFVQNPGENPSLQKFGIQANASEYTFGWVFHTPRVFGIGTFASAGAGSTAFKPSKNGGEGYQEQARATYYYNVGVEQALLSPRFGFRASFRQAFYLAPDFQETYLRNHQRTITSEPTIGFYLKF